MEHPPQAWFSQVVAAAGDDPAFGNGLFRVVLLAMLVGCVLVGWLLLRGYRNDDSDED